MTASIHHLGIVVANIEAYLPRSLWKPCGPVVIDPLQKSRLCLARLDGSDPTLIELVEPQSETSPAWGALQRGGGWHHLCLRVASMHVGNEIMRERQWLPVTPWKPAVLFDGRPVRFLYNRNRELLELVADEDSR